MPGIASGVALSAVSSVGYLGFVAGPPAIGGIAELIGMPDALFVLVLLGATVAALASTTAPRTAAAGEADEPEPERLAA